MKIIKLLKNLILALLFCIIYTCIIDYCHRRSLFSVSDIFPIAAIIFLAYLIASIPFGLIVVNYRNNTDIRTIGSGNIGATNVFRSGDKKSALITFFGDILKGAIAALLIYFCIKTEHNNVLYYLVPTLAHIFPCWLSFKGGKGVATGIGTIIALSPIMGLGMLGIWINTFIITKISAIASLVSFIMLSVVGFFIFSEQFVLFITLTLLIIISHKNNIIRMFKNKEKKL